MQLPMRPKWAEKMTRLIRPGGYLLTLMFPISQHIGGPPFAVSPQLYNELLGKSFDMLWIRDCPSVEPRNGREKLALWQMK